MALAFMLALQDAYDQLTEAEKQLGESLGISSSNSDMVKKTQDELDTEQAASQKRAASAVKNDPFGLGSLGQPGIATEGSILGKIPSRITSRGKLS